jgi:hypothetical protein
MQRLSSAVLGCLLFIAGASAAAQQPVVYPAKGQSPEKQAQDDAACYSWARQSSGVDPAQVAAAGAPPAGPQGERMRGAARGALGGAAIGAIAGDAGEGAAVGAVAGTMLGGHRARQREAAENQRAQSQQQGMSAYYRAYAACMSGRGYAVN